MKQLHALDPDGVPVGTGKPVMRQQPRLGHEERQAMLSRQPRATSPTATAITEATNGSRLVAAESVVLVGREESRA